MNQLNSRVIDLCSIRHLVTSLKSLTRIVLPALVLVLVCSAAKLEVRADTLIIGGTFAVTPSGVDFQPTGGGTGSFTVGAGQTGAFVGVAGTTGTIKDLNYSAGMFPRMRPGQASAAPPQALPSPLPAFVQ